MQTPTWNRFLLVQFGLCAWLGAGVVSAAAPADTVVVSGKTYAALELLSTTGETVTFYSSEGPFTVKWMELPAAVRERFATAYAEAFGRETSASEAALGASVAISGTVVQKLDHGLVVLWNERMVILLGHPDAKSLEVGQPVAATAKRSSLLEYRDTGGAARRARAFKFEQAILTGSQGAATP